MPRANPDYEGVAAWAKAHAASTSTERIQVDVRDMRVEALGLAGGRVRLQLSSSTAMMNVDLERQAAIDHAAYVLLLAGVSSVSIAANGHYTALAADGSSL